MGQWNISIQGHGIHDNVNSPNDADKLAKEFVQKLKDAGHEIEAAHFTVGSMRLLEPVKSSV